MCLLASVPDLRAGSVARLAEEAPPRAVLEPLPLSEKTLATVWNAQRPLHGPFWTTAHESVAIIYRGHWSGGAGPDFRGALIAFGAGQPQRGDVELHLRAADWYAHGHHADPAYNDVLLHVVYTLGGEGDGPARLTDARRARTAAGRELPTLVLGPHITVDPATLAALTLPDQLGELSEEPCWERTHHRPLDDLLAPIRAAGDARFAEKSARFEAELAVALEGRPRYEWEEAAEQVLYAGLCNGLGYHQNRAPFAALAARVPLRLLRIIAGDRPAADRTAVLEALLLGGAGLLPSQRKRTKDLDWQSAAQADEVEIQWTALRPLLGHVLDTASAPAWQFAGVRPANAPARRVAALAQLLSWMLPGGILGGFLADIRAATDPGAQATRLLARLHVAAPGSFWREHSDFGSALGRGEGGADLIGEDRAGELLINVVLPFLDAWSSQIGDRALAATAQAVYAVAPRLAENQVTRAMLGEAFGPRARQVRLGAREQQGLIGLYRRYCSTRNVYECPLSGLCRPTSSVSHSKAANTIGDPRT